MVEHKNSPAKMANTRVFQWIEVGHREMKNAYRSQGTQTKVQAKRSNASKIRWIHMQVQCFNTPYSGSVSLFPFSYSRSTCTGVVAHSQFTRIHSFVWKFAFIKSWKNIFVFICVFWFWHFNWKFLDFIFTSHSTAQNLHSTIYKFRISEK